MKDKDKTVERVIGVFALIGFLSTVLFFATLFNSNNSNSTGSCETYSEEIDELENEVIDLEKEISELKDEIDTLDYEKYELKQKVESWKEEYYALEESRGCNTGGSASLVNGSSNKGE